MTRQEMFNRAVRGLRSQGWKRSTVLLHYFEGSKLSSCRYLGSEGRRCAWGWVDPDLPPTAEGQGVSHLAARNVGLAGKLSAEDLEFAQELQDAHDEAEDDTLESRMRELGCAFELGWPND